MKGDRVLRRYLPLSLTLLLGVQLLNASASAQIPSAGALGSKNVHSEGNQENLVGNAVDFFERRLTDGSVKRYAVASTYGSGFDIVDVTNPTDPQTVSRYVSPGVNYHTWVAVNSKRNIVAMSIGDEAGVSPAHGMSNGVEFVDISDVSAPVRLSVVEGLQGSPSGKASGLQGPHTIRMIGDNHLYTTIPTYIIDYTNPRQPVNLGEQGFCGHEFYPDPNIPGRTYMGFCGSVGKWGVLDTSDPAKPKVIHEERDPRIQYAHEVFPSPDSSFVGVADFRGAGQTHMKCPGGSLHFYDISGKYIPGASLTDPKKMGIWSAPFSGKAPTDPTTLNPNVPANWSSCTLHSFQFQPERNIITAGLYTGGSWIADLSAATVPSGGDYAEFGGNPNQGLGATTWGNTKGNFIAEGDFVNATQWLPFDIPAAKDHYYTNGLIRGLDVLHYAGPIPKKLSRLTVSASAAGGVVRGVLDRYAVLTYDGWVNKPLGGKTLEIRSGGTTVTATTAPDGSFSADLGLASGSHQVTVSWPGDSEFETVALTRQVTA